MQKVIILGAAGRMGKVLIRGVQNGLAPGLQLAGAVDRPGCPDLGKDAGVLAGGAAANVALTDNLWAVLPGADLVIDFTTPASTLAAAPMMIAAKKAWVVGTTGMKLEEKAVVENAATVIPVVMSTNMSLGVNLLFCLVEQAARALKGRGYDVEIIERHHRRKKDAPSGTALSLGEAAARGLEWKLSEVAVDGRTGITGERPAAQIGFHAVRGGDIVGDHTVLFAADGECVEFSHRATSRETFALGALQAAAWLPGRSAGLYSMRDVLGLA